MITSEQLIEKQGCVLLISHKFLHRITTGTTKNCFYTKSSEEKR